MFVLRALTAAALLTGSAAFAASSLVVNGSMNGTIGRTITPSGWTAAGGSPDVMNAGNNVGVANMLYFGATPEASPDGGTWVGLGADLNLSEGISQMLTGLTVGEQYTVSWQAGNFGYDRGTVKYLGSNAINVLIDDVSIGSGASLGVSSKWVEQSLSFVAAAASQALTFKLANSNKAYMSLDGVAVQVSPVPEAGSVALMALGLVGVAMLRRRRQADQG